MMQAEEARVSSPTPDLATPTRRAAQRRQRYRGSISISRFGDVSAIITTVPTHSNYPHTDRGLHTTNIVQHTTNANGLCRGHGNICTILSLAVICMSHTWRAWSCAPRADVEFVTQ